MSPGIIPGSFDHYFIVVIVLSLWTARVGPATKLIFNSIEQKSET
jgi:hypothetical protein